MLFRSAPDRCVIHDFHATANRDTLLLQATQQGTWTLPYESIRVVLPERETRPLNLNFCGVRLTQ